MNYTCTCTCTCIQYTVCIEHVHVHVHVYTLYIDSSHSIHVHVHVHVFSIQCALNMYMYMYMYYTLYMYIDSSHSIHVHVHVYLVTYSTFLFLLFLFPLPPSLPPSLPPISLYSHSSLQYLNSASLHDPSLHDEEEFSHLTHSMDCIGLSAAEKADLFRVVAAVLHLGNITFEENTRDKKGGCVGVGVCVRVCVCVCVVFTLLLP